MSRAAPDLAAALVASLDGDALDQLAELLAPRLSRLGLVPQTGEPDGWLATADAAAYLGTTANALHKATARRELPFVQNGPGGRCYFRREDLDAWRCGDRPIDA